MRLLRILPLLVILLGLAPRADPSDSSPARPCAFAAARPADHGEPVVESDDRVRLRELEDTAERLIEKGQVTPLETLRRQLGRRQCPLKLPKSSALRLSPGDVYETCKGSVLIVAGVAKCETCGRWHPTPAGGFVISESGAFVTNYHVVNNEKHLTLLAMTHDGTVLPVKEVLAASRPDDAAVLRFDPGAAKIAPLALAPDSRVGDPILVISHPDRRFYMLTQGIVSRQYRIGKSTRPVAKMSVTADFALGSSGGPILNESGAVVGMVESTSSLYYTNDDGKKDNLQMVVKQCVPAASVLKLIKQ